VKGQTFQDWFIHDYMLNKVGQSSLVSGFFWDECVFFSLIVSPCVSALLLSLSLSVLPFDYKSSSSRLCCICSFWPAPGGGFPDARSGQVANDTGLAQNLAGWGQITDAYHVNMDALREKTLSAGKFAWQVLRNALIFLCLLMISS
jgi:hypothetical protein